jgi:hypothetical protein
MSETGPKPVNEIGQQALSVDAHRHAELKRATHHSDPSGTFLNQMFNKCLLYRRA